MSMPDMPATHARSEIPLNYDGGMNAKLSIGLVARQTGCTVPTIRYYEDIGLLPPASRTDSGQRHYDKRAIRRLTFIRRCRNFGFSIDQVRELVSLVDQPDRPCQEVRDVAALHLMQVRAKLDELQALEASLSTFVRSCESACVGGPTVDCTILENLEMPADQNRIVRGGAGCCAS